jgi:MFS family permease
MAEVTYQPEVRSSFRRGSMDWSAIWAGLFTFVAIWSVFGLLGSAIFGSASTPPTHGDSVGMGIWAVILTLIAMYIGGWVTGKLAGLDGRAEAVVHGMVMFGLSVTAILVLRMSGRLFLTGLLPGGNTLGLPGVYGASEWFGFFALFLGWLAALGGAASGVKARPVLPSKVQDIRPAA